MDRIPLDGRAQYLLAVTPGIRSFTGMRECYLEAFGAIRVDCPNGDKYKMGKTAPDGRPDPSIFSTPGDPVGIQVSTAIATSIRKAEYAPAGTERNGGNGTGGAVRIRQAVVAVGIALCGCGRQPTMERLAVATRAVPDVIPGRQDQP